MKSDSPVKKSLKKCVGGSCEETEENDFQIKKKVVRNVVSSARGVVLIKSDDAALQVFSSKTRNCNTCLKSRVKSAQQPFLVIITWLG